MVELINRKTGEKTDLELDNVAEYIQNILNKQYKV